MKPLINIKFISIEIEETKTVANMGLTWFIISGISKNIINKKVSNKDKTESSPLKPPKIISTDTKTIAMVLIVSLLLTSKIWACSISPSIICKETIIDISFLNSIL